MKMGNLSFAKQIHLFGVVMMLAMLGGAIVYYHDLRAQRLETRNRQLQAAVETAWGVIHHFAGQPVRGGLNAEAAKEASLAALFSLASPGVDNFWVIDTERRQLLRRSGKVAGSAGAAVVREPLPAGLSADVAATLKENGSGFVTYLPEKTGGATKPELSFVKSYPDWHWLVGGTASKNGVGELQRLRLTLMVGLILMALLIGSTTWLLARSLVRPLRGALSTLYRISHGELDETLPMGVPVNCSQHKKCGNQSCPAFGKVDHCWVTAGSFAVIKKCPHALKGGDCRECKMFGARNEMEELGGMIGALTISLRQRAGLSLEIARGDLSREVELSSAKDMFGGALQEMVGGLRGLIGEIHAAGEMIASGSAQISGASQSLARGASEHSAALQEITSSLAEISAGARSNAVNLAEADELATAANRRADEGQRRMEALVEAIAASNQAGQSISRIIQVIDEIAFQTNLLALNAAVEAARAGQHGRGFAVVAEEVRNLAGRSAAAARETTELIKSSVQKTSLGAKLVEHSAQAFDQIVADVNRVAELVAEISASSAGQSKEVEFITSGLQRIEETSMLNSASSEESAAVAEELASQAELMRCLTSRFSMGNFLALPQ